MDYTEILAQVLIIISVLTIFVNIITEVVKNTFTMLNTTAKINVFVLLLSVAITLAVFIAYWQIQQMTITWYLLIAFVVVGILVAYSAMFGYDKLMSYFSSATSTDSEGD